MHLINPYILNDKQIILERFWFRFDFFGIFVCDKITAQKRLLRNCTNVQWIVKMCIHFNYSDADLHYGVIIGKIHTSWRL